MVFCPDPEPNHGAGWRRSSSAELRRTIARAANSVRRRLALGQAGLAQTLDDARVRALKVGIVRPADVGPILHSEAGRQFVEAGDCRLGFRCREPRSARADHLVELRGFEP
jgi:hypothetical protein